MKKWILVPLLALLLAMAACSQQSTESSQTASSLPATRDTATRAATTAAASTAASTAPSTAATTKAVETKVVAATKATAATSPTVQKNIPADTITGGNINPYLSYIQGNVMEEIRALAVTDIALERSSLTLNKGESAELSVEIEPSYAANKKCSVMITGSAVKASYKSGVLTIQAVEAGEATVTVSSHNGLTASCVVTVTDEKHETAPETTEAAQPTEEEPSEEPSETAAENGAEG